MLGTMGTASTEVLMVSKIPILGLSWLLLTMLLEGDPFLKVQLYPMLKAELLAWVLLIP